MSAGYQGLCFAIYLTVLCVVARWRILREIHHPSGDGEFVRAGGVAIFWPLVLPVMALCWAFRRLAPGWEALWEALRALATAGAALGQVWRSRPAPAFCGPFSAGIEAKKWLWRAESLRSWTAQIDPAFPELRRAGLQLVIESELQATMICIEYGIAIPEIPSLEPEHDQPESADEPVNDAGSHGKWCKGYLAQADLREATIEAQQQLADGQRAYAAALTDIAAARQRREYEQLRSEGVATQQARAVAVSQGGLIVKRSR